MDIKSLSSLVPMPSTLPNAPPQTRDSASVPKETYASQVSTGNVAGVEPSKQNSPVTGKENANTAENEQAYRQNLQDSVEKLNDFVLPYNTSLSFSIDEDIGTVVVKVTDKETKEVIKQLPSEEALELAKALDKLKGLLVQQKA